MTLSVGADNAWLLAFLRDLIRTHSSSGLEEAIVRHIVQEMRDLGYEEARVDEAGNAVGRLGAGRPVVLIDGHVDTIPLHSLERWAHDPLGAEIEDGRLYGLGSC